MVPGCPTIHEHSPQNGSTVQDGRHGTNNDTVPITRTPTCPRLDLCTYMGSANVTSHLLIKHACHLITIDPMTSGPSLVPTPLTLREDRTYTEIPKLGIIALVRFKNMELLDFPTINPLIKPFHHACDYHGEQE